VFLLAALSLVAESRPRPRPSKLRWWLSVAALSAAAALDVHSSWGRRELNPMLQSPNGRFNARGLAVKSSILGTSCGLQWLLLERRWLWLLLALLALTWFASRKHKLI